MRGMFRRIRCLITGHADPAKVSNVSTLPLPGVPGVLLFQGVTPRCPRCNRVIPKQQYS